VNTAGDERGAKHDTEGLVDCGVHATPPDGAPSSVEVSQLEHEVVRLAFENVECELETDPGNREAQIERMQAAFDELASLRP
jgi:hypothetical protein